MSPEMKIQLAVALLICALFAVGSAIGVGVSLHGLSETHDSLEHWRARVDEPQPPNALSMDKPANRIKRLEQDLASHTERVAVCGVMFVFFGGLVALGVRKWRKDG